MATDTAEMGTGRKVPRISINKLGEYMTATPLRRRRIVLDQKPPKTFVVLRYSEAQDAITKYLVRGSDEAALTAEIERLALAPSATEWEEQRKQLCIEAMERFLEFAAQIDLHGCTAVRAGNDQPRLVMGGLEVSVRPEVHLRGHDRSGRPAAGAIKLYFSKTIPLSGEGGGYVATAVHQFVDTHVAPGRTNPQLCQVVDVFAQNIFTAPRATARRSRDLWAACEEFARTWAAL